MDKLPNASSTQSSNQPLAETPSAPSSGSFQGAEAPVRSAEAPSLSHPPSAGRVGDQPPSAEGTSAILLLSRPTAAVISPPALSLANVRKPFGEAIFKAVQVLTTAVPEPEGHTLPSDAALSAMTALSALHDSCRFIPENAGPLDVAQVDDWTEQLKAVHDNLDALLGGTQNGEALSSIKKFLEGMEKALGDLKMAFRRGSGPTENELKSFHTAISESAEAIARTLAADNLLSEPPSFSEADFARALAATSAEEGLPSQSSSSAAASAKTALQSLKTSLDDALHTLNAHFKDFKTWITDLIGRGTPQLKAFIGKLDTQWNKLSDWISKHVTAAHFYEGLKAKFNGLKTWITQTLPAHIKEMDAEVDRRIVKMLEPFIAAIKPPLDKASTYLKALLFVMGFGQVEVAVDLAALQRFMRV